MHTKLDACLDTINQVLLGKEAQVRLALTCPVSYTHLTLPTICSV